jgi:hypothetical protein
MELRTRTQAAALAVFAIASAACGGSSSPPAPPATVVVDGPLDYVAVAGRLAAPVGIPRTVRPDLRRLTTGGRSTAGTGAVSGDIAATTGVIAAICPEAAPVLGPISVISQWVSGNQVAGEISTIDSQLTVQQGEINTLQQQVASLNQAYLNLVAADAIIGACGALGNWVSLQQGVYAPGVSMAPGTFCGSTFTNGSVTASLGYKFSQYALHDASSTSPDAILATTANLNSNALNQRQMSDLNGLASNPVLPSGETVSQAASDLSMSGPVSNYSPNMGLSIYAQGLPTLAEQIQAIRDGIQVEGTTPISACSGNGASTNTTALLLACAYQAFITNDLPTQGTSDGGNVLTLVADWNQYVMSVYQQNLIALTYLYDLEAISSYMNFYQWNQYLTAQICSTTPPPSWASCPANPPSIGSVPFQQISPWESALPVSFSVGTLVGQTPTNSLGLNCTNSPCTVSPGASSSSVNPFTITQASFLQAQQNLAVLYAQRVNDLYRGAMSFIISDPPLSTQPYTPPSPTRSIPASSVNPSYTGVITVSYPDQTTLYTTIPAANLGAIAPPSTYLASVVVPGQNIIGIAAGNNPAIPAQSFPGVLYQYQGVNNVYSCTGAAALARNSAAQELVTLTNCTTPFPSTNSGTYDGVDFTAYAQNSAATGGAVQTNSTSAWSVYPNPPTIFNGAYLLPGAWAGSNLYGPVLEGSTTQPFGFGSSCTGTTSVCASYWAMVNSLYSDSYSYSVASDSLANDFSLIASSDGSSWGYGNGNFYTQGSGSSWQLKDGGLSPNSPILDHVALLQVTLPNGYNLPFYLVTAELDFILGPHGPGAASTPVCPNVMAGAWPPGLSNCWQQDVGNGGIGVETTDGAVYYVNVSTNQQGSASLSVSTSPTNNPLYSYNGVAAPSGSYTSSCSNISWNGYTLWANCQDDARQYAHTSITYQPSAGNCAYGSTVTNSNGALVCN